MRFLLYNIAYGTGGPKGYTHSMITWPRYLLAARHQMHYLQEFLQTYSADIVGLVELDSGSIRARGRNHAAEIARNLEHNYTYSVKYHDRSPARWLPYFRHQGNALFAEQPIETYEHHFLPMGFKRLVLDVTVNGIRILLVHLALNKRTRRRQLQYLSTMAGEGKKPLIIAGDFNSFQGKHELNDLIEWTDLQTVNYSGTPTFPSWKPRKELDFILVSKSVNVRDFRVLSDIKLSDHLPLLLDFESV